MMSRLQNLQLQMSETPSQSLQAERLARMSQGEQVQRVLSSGRVQFVATDQPDSSLTPEVEQVRIGARSTQVAQEVPQQQEQHQQDSRSEPGLPESSFHSVQQGLPTQSTCSMHSVESDESSEQEEVAACSDDQKKKLHQSVRIKLDIPVSLTLPECCLRGAQTEDRDRTMGSEPRRRDIGHCASASPTCWGKSKYAPQAPGRHTVRSSTPRQTDGSGYPLQNGPLPCPGESEGPAYFQQSSYPLRTAQCGCTECQVRSECPLRTTQPQITGYPVYLDYPTQPLHSDYTQQPVNPYYSPRSMQSDSPLPLFRQRGSPSPPPRFRGSLTPPVQPECPFLARLFESFGSVSGPPRTVQQPGPAAFSPFSPLRQTNWPGSHGSPANSTYALASPGSRSESPCPYLSGALSDYELPWDYMVASTRGAETIRVKTAVKNQLTSVDTSLVAILLILVICLVVLLFSITGCGI